MKIYGIIRTAIYWALTALVLVFISTLAEIEVLRYFIGGLMMFYGVEEIILTAIKHKKHFEIHSLYWNLVEIVIGLTLVVFVETGDIEVTYAVVCVGWAIWSILRETRELIEATEELKENHSITHKVVAIVSLLESLTIIALSLTLLIEPGQHHAKIHLYLLAVELFTKVLFPLVNYIAKHLEEKKREKAEKMAVDTPQSETVDEVAEGEVAASHTDETLGALAAPVGETPETVETAQEELPAEEAE